MALSAEGHVHIFASNHNVTFFAGCAEGERSVLLAEFADGSQLFNLLALWY